MDYQFIENDDDALKDNSVTSKKNIYEERTNSPISFYNYQKRLLGLKYSAKESGETMRKLLIVDDEPVNCRLLRELLNGKAFCDAVFSGRDAVDIFEVAFRTGNNYDLILLDIAMPEMDGLEVLDRIREYEENNGVKLGTGVPVIIVNSQ